MIVRIGNALHNAKFQSFFNGTFKDVKVANEYRNPNKNQFNAIIKDAILTLKAVILNLFDVVGKKNR